METTSSSIDILIIGAGVTGAAGLMARKQLLLVENNSSMRVRLVEAFSMFGGRIRQTDSFVDYPIDLGASWAYDPKFLPEMLLLEKKKTIFQRLKIPMNNTKEPSDFLCFPTDLGTMYFKSIWHHHRKGTLFAIAKLIRFTFLWRIP